MSRVEYYFDFSCPYAYLGSTQIEALCAARAAELHWKPMLLGGVFRAVGTAQNMGADMPAPKARHNLLDMHRWARRWNVELAVPAGHPFRCVRALRALLSLPESDWPRVIHALYRTYWVENRDVADPDVIDAALERAGIEAADRARARAANDDPAIKDELRRRTDEAIARGVFGAPAMFVDGPGGDHRMFWGQDRLELVDVALGGDKPPPTTCEAGDAAGAELHFFYDFSSPFAYLGFTQIADVARRINAALVLKPFLLGGLFRELGTPDVPLLSFSPAKQRYITGDLEAWASHLGVPYRFPTHFPMRTVKALRLALAAGPDNDAVGAVSAALFRALWVDDRDIDDTAVLAAILDEAGLDPSLVDRIGDPDVKARLFETTGEARDRGVFGAPTTIVCRPGRDDELFWGQDRLEMAARAAIAP